VSFLLPLCFLFDKKKRKLVLFREQEGGIDSAWKQGVGVEEGGPNNIYTY
jgi:hypothetical protein